MENPGEGGEFEEGHEQMHSEGEDGEDQPGDGHASVAALAVHEGNKGEDQAEQGKGSAAAAADTAEEGADQTGDGEVVGLAGGEERRGSGAGAWRGGRRRELREGGKGTPVGGALGLDESGAVDAALGEPLAQDVLGDWPVGFAVAAQDFIHDDWG